MRRFRLHRGGKIQAGIIDNLKPSLYQIPRNIQEKNNKQKQLYSQIPYKQPPLASSRLITGCLKLQMSSQRLICPHGKNKMPSAYVKFDGHMTISGIFGNEQFPVVN